MRQQPNEVENLPSEPHNAVKRTLLPVPRRELVADDRVALHAPLDQSVLQSHHSKSSHIINNNNKSIVTSAADKATNS